MKLVWSAEARAQLQAIRSFIAEHAEAEATAVIERLIHRGAQIGEFPHSGRKVPEYAQDDLREVLQRPYRIIYRIQTDQVTIITVRHYRQLLPDSDGEL